MNLYKFFLSTAVLLVLLVVSVNSGLAMSFTSTATHDQTEFVDNTNPVPFGMTEIKLIVHTDTLGQALYQRAYGTLNGYSLEKANEIVMWIPIGMIPDCRCNDPEPEFRLKPKYGSPICTDCFGNTEFGKEPTCKN